MLCARCSKPLPDAAVFCPSCGAPVAQARGDLAPLGPSAVGSSPHGAAEAALPAPDLAAPGAPAIAGGGAPAVAVELRYGGFWRRLLAFIVDGCIIGAVMLPFRLGLGLANMASVLNSEEVTAETVVSMLAASLLVWFIGVVASWIYGAGFESSRFQATPGKMIVGVKVTDLHGGRISFARATGRQLGKWLSGLILGIGYLLVAFSDRKQGLHDMMAGTLVRRGGTESR